MNRATERNELGGKMIEALKLSDKPTKYFPIYENPSMPIQIKILTAVKKFHRCFASTSYD